jgi:hypothetical protein
MSKDYSWKGIIRQSCPDNAEYLIKEILRVNREDKKKERELMMTKEEKELLLTQKEKNREQRKKERELVKLSMTEEEKELLEIQKENLKKQRKFEKELARSLMTEEQIQAEKLKVRERNLKKESQRLDWRKNNKDKIKEYNKSYYKKLKEEE